MRIFLIFMHGFSIDKEFFCRYLILCQSICNIVGE